jgi:hypothetical protein
VACRAFVATAQRSGFTPGDLMPLFSGGAVYGPAMAACMRSGTRRQARSDLGCAPIRTLLGLQVLMRTLIIDIDEAANPIADAEFNLRH